MSELEDALGAPGVASWVLRAVTRDLRVRSRVDGASSTFPPEVELALRLLQCLADGAPQLSASGHPTSTKIDVTAGMEPIAVAAARAECGVRRARRLAASGRVRSLRIAPRCLLVDTDGLRRIVRSET